MSRHAPAAPEAARGGLHLVRHGRPLIDPAVRSTRWRLDPAHQDEVRALRGSLPPGARWCCSPEPKARETAALLTDDPVAIVDDLREQGRSGWFEDLDVLVDRAFAAPDVPAADGWETLADCRTRVATTVGALRASHPDGDLVLVGHGTAWTVLLAHLDGTAADPTTLRSLRFPDLVTR